MVTLHVFKQTKLKLRKTCTMQMGVSEARQASAAMTAEWRGARSCQTCRKRLQSVLAHNDGLDGRRQKLGRKDARDAFAIVELHGRLDPRVVAQLLVILLLVLLLRRQLWQAQDAPAQQGSG